MLQNIGNRVKDNKHLQTLQPGTIGTIRKLRINKRRIGTSHRSIPTNCGPNISNLLVVNTTNYHNQEGASNNMSIATLNARSVKNKNYLNVQSYMRHTWTQL